MSTGDLRIETYTGKVLSAQETQLRFFDLLEKYSADILRNIFSFNGGLFDPVGIVAGSGNDQISFDVPVKGFNGDGLLANPEGTNWQAYMSDVPFVNDNGVLYYVAVKPEKIPYAPEVNARTSQIEYYLEEEAVGYLSAPYEVIDNGDDTLTITVSNDGGVTPANDAVGRTIFVWLKQPLTETSDWREAVVAVDDGGASKITTAGLLGQGAGLYPVSTDPQDYVIFIAGPAIAENDLSTDPSLIFIGTVDGNGPGATPTSFDTTGQTVFNIPNDNALNILQLARDLYTSPSLDGDGNPNLPTPLQTLIANNASAIAALTVDPSVVGNLPSFDTITGGLQDSGVSSALVAALIVSPSVSGNVPQFNTITGGLADSGVAMSALNNLIVNPSGIGNVVSFADANGGLVDSGFLASQIAAIIVNPSVVGNFVTFADVTGGLADSGYAASNFTDLVVNPSTVGNLPSFDNATGGLQDSGIAAAQITTNASNIGNLQTAVAALTVSPSVIGNIPTFDTVTGGLQDGGTALSAILDGTALNDDSITARTINQDVVTQLAGSGLTANGDQLDVSIVTIDSFDVSGHVWDESGVIFSAAETKVVQTFRVTIPSGKDLVLKRVRTHLTGTSGATFSMPIEWDNVIKYTASSSADSGDLNIICASGPLSDYIEITIYSTSAETLYFGGGWVLTFAYEDTP